MKKEELQSKLVKLMVKRKEVEEEEKEVRLELASKMKEEEYVKIPHGGKMYRVMNEKSETRVLHDAQFIAKNIGKTAFLQIAKVSIGDLTTVVGKEEIGKYIHRIDTAYKVVVREDKPNGTQKAVQA